MRVTCLFVAMSISWSACTHTEPTTQDPSSVVTETPPAQQAPPGAPLFEGLDGFSHPITVSNPVAQRYFDQGLMLSFGFNHAEAERSFRHAAALDEDCAMCWWGVAYVLGPNINAPMSPDAGPKVQDALRRAQALASKASPEEQDYIEALSKRYSASSADNQMLLNVAYAAAMKEVASEYPDDLDATVLAAEALMDLHPWDFYDFRTGEARPWTAEILALLEGVLETEPNHPMANHLYIHLTEASHEPERALPAAARLPKIAPGAGHLVHMPAHVYIRVGRYHDASLANQAAVDADQAYITQCRAQGMYPLAYHPHNYHFLSRTASLEGRSAVALDAAMRMNAHVPPAVMRDPELSTLQHYWITPLYVMTRFGMWEQILAYPKPDADLVYPVGVWHYARGLAFVAEGKLKEARTELAALIKISDSPELEAVSVWGINTARSLLQIARLILGGELAAKRKQTGRAIALLRKAVALEDRQNYDEPPSWYVSTRLVLGAVYLQARNPKAAERVYREDLLVFPNNGWALFGLAQALEAQGKRAQAAQVRAEFEVAWTNADVELTASRFM